MFQELEKEFAAITDETTKTKLSEALAKAKELAETNKASFVKEIQGVRAVNSEVRKALGLEANATVDEIKKTLEELNEGVKKTTQTLTTKESEKLNLEKRLKAIEELYTNEKREKEAAKRSNGVRTALLNVGVNPERIEVAESIALQMYTDEDGFEGVAKKVIEKIPEFLTDKFKGGAGSHKAGSTPSMSLADAIKKGDKAAEIAAIEHKISQKGK